MRISKIVVALLVSVVALTAMTGVAVADPLDVDISHDEDPSSPSIPYSPSYTTYNVTPNKIWSDGPHNMWVEMLTVGSGSIDDLEFRICTVDESNVPFSGYTGNVLNTTPCSDWYSADTTTTLTTEWNWGSIGDTGDPALSVGYQILRMDVRAKGTAPELNLYTFKVHDRAGAQSGGEAGSGSTRGTSVPEFATIAIPAIAVLGLFLFFNKRKHKKD